MNTWEALKIVEDGGARVEHAKGGEIRIVHDELNARMCIQHPRRRKDAPRCLLSLVRKVENRRKLSCNPRRTG